MFFTVKHKYGFEFKPRPPVVMKTALMALKLKWFVSIWFIFKYVAVGKESQSHQKWVTMKKGCEPPV